MLPRLPQEKYINILNIDEFRSMSAKQLPENSFNGFVYHFGVSEELWEEVKDEYNQKWSLETFVDSYYDTRDFKLAQENYWLRQRDFRNGKYEWTLITSEDNQKGYCIVTEVKDNQEILEILANFVPKRGQPNMITDPICKTLELENFTFFPTTRVVLEQCQDHKLYLDCSIEEFTDTWFFIGGIQFKDPNKLTDVQTKWKQYSKTPVMSKVTQIISWKDPTLYDSLVSKGYLCAQEHYLNEDHIYSEKEPVFDQEW